MRTHRNLRKHLRSTGHRRRTQILLAAHLSLKFDDWGEVLHESFFLPAAKELYVDSVTINAGYLAFAEYFMLDFVTFFEISIVFDKLALDIYRLWFTTKEIDEISSGLFLRDATASCAMSVTSFISTESGIFKTTNAVGFFKLVRNLTNES